MGLRFPLCSHQLLRPDLELARRLAVWLQHFGAGQALGTSSSDTFSHPACRFLSPLTNRRRNWRNNAQVHVLAISLLPWTLTNTAMGKKKHNCNKMLHVSPSIFKACIWGKIVFLDSIVQKHCPSISSTLSLSYKYYFHKMQSELMLFFYMSFLCHKITIPAEIEFILQHPYSKKSLKDYQKAKAGGGHLAFMILRALRFWFRALGIFFTSCLGTFYHPPLSCSKQLPFILSSSSSLWQ